MTTTVKSRPRAAAAPDIDGGLDNLYVVDSSASPSIGVVIPALRAMANAMRIGYHLLERLGVQPQPEPAHA
jgi:choline dehydrogenase-like flavoprotein